MAMAGVGRQSSKSNLSLLGFQQPSNGNFFAESGPPGSGVKSARPPNRSPLRRSRLQSHPLSAVPALAVTTGPGGPRRSALGPSVVSSEGVRPQNGGNPLFSFVLR